MIGATLEAIVDTVAVAWLAGKGAASAALVGHTPFTGAQPAADAAGYHPRHAGRDAFVCGYVSAMPRSGVVVDDLTGYVVNESPAVIAQCHRVGMGARYSLHGDTSASS